MEFDDMTYQEYLAHLEKTTHIFELIRIIQHTNYDEKLILFKDPKTTQELINKFEYCQNRFILTFMSSNSESTETNPGVSSLLLRILEAHERFYVEYLNNIRSAPKIVFDGLDGIFTCIKPLKEYFKHNIRFYSAPAEKNTKEIDNYLLTNASEKENGGYFNPILDSLLPTIPKHHKYSLIIGTHTFPFSNPEIYNKIFAPTKDEHQKSINHDHAFIDSYHSVMMASFAVNKISMGEKSPNLFNQVDLESELQKKLQELKKIEDDKRFLENYYNKKQEDERQAQMEEMQKEMQRKYDEEHPSNPWDESPN